MAGIRVVTFDCYGTLVDWEGGAASFLYELALRNAYQAEPSATVSPRPPRSPRRRACAPAGSGSSLA